MAGKTGDMSFPHNSKSKPGLSTPEDNQSSYKYEMDLKQQTTMSPSSCTKLNCQHMTPVAWQMMA